VREAREDGAVPLSSLDEETNAMDSPGVADPPPLYSTDAVGRYLNVICCPPGAACESCPSMSVSMERADGSDSHTASAEETNSRSPPSSDAPEPRK
jgi:hypothetical protein